MVTIFIILAIILIIVVTFALGWRKQNFAKIDRAEERKVELMNRPVLEEVARIRSLHVEGEVESSYTQWKDRWEEVMTVRFPQMEEDFFTCESMVEKFRFGKANEILDEINGKLDEIEVIINVILSESGELLELAKKNETNLDKIQVRLNEKKLYIVAIKHLLGESVSVLDEKIDGHLTQVDEIKETMKSGDYFAVTPQIENLQIKSQVLENTIKVIPDLLNECNKNLPATIDMLKQAHAAMTEEGYPLESLKIEQQIKDLEITLNLNLQSLEIAVIDGVKESIYEVNNIINEICRLLEGESNSKVVVKEKLPALIKVFGENKKSLNELLEVVENARKKYRIPDKTEDSVVDLKIKFIEIADSLEKVGNLFVQKEEAFSILEKRLLEIEADMVRIDLDLTSNLEGVASLMVDEQDAINKVAKLRETFWELDALVRLSNAPGISIRHQTISSDTLSSIDEVSARLHDAPLNIVALKDALQSAERKIATLERESQELVENAQLAEKVIQYGNRYRIGNEDLSEELDKASEKFMIFEYSKSLEIASIAIEQVEPGFAKKFDAAANEYNEDDDDDDEDNA